MIRILNKSKHKVGLLEPGESMMLEDEKALLLLSGRLGKRGAVVRVEPTPHPDAVATEPAPAPTAVVEAEAEPEPTPVKAKKGKGS